MSTSDYNLFIFACLIVPPSTLALAGIISTFVDMIEVLNEQD